MRHRPIYWKYACFHCRKAFSRQVEWLKGKGRYKTAAGEMVEYDRSYPQLTSTCPECAGPLYFMGQRFKVPPRNKLKEWQRWEEHARHNYMDLLRESRELASRIDPYFSKQTE